MRRGQGWITQLFGVERMTVRVAVFTGGKSDGGLDELQEEVILCPLF